jgi:hypothetical protein
MRKAGVALMGVITEGACTCLSVVVIWCMHTYCIMVVMYAVSLIAAIRQFVVTTALMLCYCAERLHDVVVAAVLCRTLCDLTSIVYCHITDTTVIATTLLLLLPVLMLLLLLSTCTAYTNAAAVKIATVFTV